MDETFNYKEAFNQLDLAAVKQDLFDLMTDSQDWWPADYGHYGPFSRMAWHSAGTYRVGDGRGGASAGTLRFAPLNSGQITVTSTRPEDCFAHQTKVRQQHFWADLMVLTGNCALESMGFKTLDLPEDVEDVGARR